MPDRELLVELNGEQVDIQRRGISDASDVVSVTVAGDDLAPSAPSGVTANSVPDGVKVEWYNETTNADGTPCVDQRWAKLYYDTTTGVSKSVNDGYYIVAAKQGTNSAFVDMNVGAGTTMYYIVTAMDSCGNESSESSEVSADGGGSSNLTDIPDDATNLVFDDTLGTEGIVVGDGILGVAFKNPASTWSGFDHFRLWYAVDSGGGFGAWTEISPTNRIGYVHKGLTTTYAYKYKATIVAADGTESSTPDEANNSGSGFTPNGSDNSLIVAELIFAENIVATNEVRGEHFFAQSYLAINDTTFGNDGIQLEYNSGNPRAYIGDGSNEYLQFDGTNLTWNTANTTLDASGNLAVDAKISVNDATFGNDGIQLDYNSGNPRAYIGDGTNAYFQFDGTKIQWKAANSELDASGNLIVSNATVSGAITITSGSGIASLSDAGALATADDLDDVSDGSTYARVKSTEISAGKIVLVGSTAQVNINNSTFGNDGIQLQYNGGNPRCYIGDGSNQYFKFDGTKIQWKAANSQLDSSGNLTVTNATVTGALTAGAGSTVDGTYLQNIDAADINTGTLTGRIIRTASSGKRVIMAPSDGGITHVAHWYDSSNDLRTAIWESQFNCYNDDAHGNNAVAVLGMDGNQNGTLLIYNSAGTGTITLAGDATPTITLGNANATIDASGGDLTLDADDDVILKPTGGVSDVVADCDMGIYTYTPSRAFAVNQGAGNMIADEYDIYSLAEYKEDTLEISGALEKICSVPVINYRRVPHVSADELKDVVIEEFGEERWNAIFPGKRDYRGGGLMRCQDQEVLAFIDKTADNLRKDRRELERWQRRYVGILADSQEISENMPEVQARNRDGIVDGISLTSYISMLHAAIIELNEKVEKLS